MVSPPGLTGGTCAIGATLASRARCRLSTAGSQLASAVRPPHGNEALGHESGPARGTVVPQALFQPAWRRRAGLCRIVPASPYPPGPRPCWLRLTRVGQSKWCAALSPASALCPSQPGALVAPAR